jgi:hypothetical protein
MKQRRIERSFRGKKLSKMNEDNFLQQCREDGRAASLCVTVQHAESEKNIHKATGEI